MVKLIKSFSIFLLVAVSLVFAVILYAQSNIPDHIMILNDQGISVGKLFTVEKSDELENNQETRNKKTDSRTYNIDISLLNVIPVKQSTVHISQRHYVVPGGEIFGLKLYSDGVMVVGTTDVLTSSGNVCPAKAAGIKPGDIILKLNGVSYNKSTDIAGFFKSNGKESVKITLLRNGAFFDVMLTPSLSSADGQYKAGIWIRDSAAGIGTVTYCDPESRIFASLGHAVCDVDTAQIIPILNGEAVKAKITGCYKGTSNKAGELCGVFSDGTLGPIMINGETGVYGLLNNAKKGSLLPVATEKEISIGKAQIISTVDSDGPAYYDIEITRFNGSSNGMRNMTIEVTDPVLLKKTGGIVQGMSGSPIIQNGMLVGAVTHVFVNDSSKGYAIFAENMIDTSDYLYDYLYQEAS